MFRPLRPYMAELPLISLPRLSDFTNWLSLRWRSTYKNAAATPISIINSNSTRYHTIRFWQHWLGNKLGFGRSSYVYVVFWRFFFPDEERVTIWDSELPLPDSCSGVTGSLFIIFIRSFCISWFDISGRLVFQPPEPAKRFINREYEVENGSRR